MVHIIIFYSPQSWTVLFGALDIWTWHHNLLCNWIFTIFPYEINYLFAFGFYCSWTDNCRVCWWLVLRSKSSEANWLPLSMQSHLLSFGFHSRMMDLRTTSVFLIGHSLLQIPKFSMCSVYPGGILPLYVESMILVLGNRDKVSKDTDCGWWHFLAWKRGPGGTFLNLLLCVVESIVNRSRSLLSLECGNSLHHCSTVSSKLFSTDLNCCKKIFVCTLHPLSTLHSLKVCGAS